jgi:hypothetical protein
MFSVNLAVEEVLRLYFKGYLIKDAIDHVKQYMNTYEKEQLDKELKKIKEELK